MKEKPVEPLYEVWREVNGHAQPYSREPRSKKDAIKVATYQTSISIHRYFIQEVGATPEKIAAAITKSVEWSRCRSCLHEWKDAGGTSDCCPICGHKEWSKIDGPTPLPAVVIDMQSRPRESDARSVPDVIAEAKTIGAVPKIEDGKLTFGMAERIWAHCRECKCEWEPISESDACPSCGDLDWDVIDPPHVSSSRIGPVETRREAHDVSKEDPRSNRERVVALLKAQGIRGMTCDEIEVADGMQFTTAGAIIIDLRLEGWVVQGVTEPTRPTRRGSAACVWVHLDYQIPEGERNVAKMGKGKYKDACEQAYALMLADGWEDAMSVLAAAMGKTA